GLIAGLILLLKAIMDTIYTNLGFISSKEQTEPANNGGVWFKLRKRAKYPILVLRGVDDEASVSLAAGNFVVLMSRMMSFFAAYTWLFMAVLILLVVVIVFVLSIEQSTVVFILFIGLGVGPLLVVSLLLIATIAKGVFGREFLLG